MKKKILSMALAICLAFGSASALPQGAFTDSTSITASAETEGDYEYTLQSGGYVWITKYTGSESDVRIPSMLGGSNVTSINTRAFEKNTNIVNVVIPSGVTFIGGSAFNGCTSMKSVSIPDSVTTINSMAFFNCTSLESVTIPKRVERIAMSTFNNCKNLKTINLSSGLKYIYAAAFMDCDSLTSITIPDTVTTIEQNVFYGCDSLTSVTLPESVKTIGLGAFCDCKSLMSITIPKSVTQIDERAFGYYYNGKYPKIDGFKIYCYKGSEGARYAIDNEFDFEYIKCKVHSYELTTSKDPTCTENGAKEYVCPDCDDAYTETIKAPGHSWSAWTTTKAATCTVDGTKTRTCSTCKKSETQTITKLGHSWSAVTYTWSSDNKTCTAKRVCKNNSAHVETQTVNSTSTVKTQPTCTVKGTTTYTATFTNSAFAKQTKSVQNIAATGHKWGGWINSGFDIAKGTRQQTRTCSVCKTKETKSIAGAVTRLAGGNRYGTAGEISKAMFDNKTNKATTVVLANGLVAADALAGVPLATKLNAPILLTTTDKVPDETMAEIKRLGAKKVVILGGTGAISEKVEKTLKVNGLTVERLAGKTRFETAAKIADKLQTEAKKAPTEAFFVYYNSYADALSASTVAAIKEAPIFYVTTDGKLDDATKAQLDKIKSSITKAYVIGGTGVISENMKKNISTALGNKTVERVSGGNRYSTCVEVNNKFKSVLTGKAICVAKGLDFPDALAGGVFAAKNKAPLFLADNKLQDVQTEYLKSKKADSIYIFGGTGAVPDSLVQSIAKSSV